MKQIFIVRDFVVSFQKFVFGFFSFGIAWIFSWLILDIIKKHHHAEFIILGFFLVILAFLMLTCSLLCFFGHYGIEVDMQRKTWRQFIGMLGLKYGKHEPFPETMHYILVFESIKPAVEEMEMGVYEVSVVYNGESRKIFLQSQSRRHANSTAQKLSEIFGLEMVDKIS